MVTSGLDTAHSTLNGVRGSVGPGSRGDVECWVRKHGEWPDEWSHQWARHDWASGPPRRVTGGPGVEWPATASMVLMPMQCLALVPVDVPPVR